VKSTLNRLLYLFLVPIILICANSINAGAYGTAPEGDATKRVSVASDGMEGSGSSSNPSISADGRYAAFASSASNLVSGDTNGSSDIFVHDDGTSETSRVSVASNGMEGSGSSGNPSISADGRYAAFVSSAPNLASGVWNGYQHVYVHDRLTGETSQVSVASDGAQGNSNSLDVSISADGRYVAFSSAASNLVSGDTNGSVDIFVRDRQAGETLRVSVASDGTQGNGGSSSYPSISADGRYVAFSSLASNLVSGDTNGSSDIFLRDRQTRETLRVSVASDGTQGNSGCFFPSISGDGRYVAFASSASNLVSGDTNGNSDIFLHDRQTGETSRVSVASGDTQGSGGSSSYPSVSADGRYVAFSSAASNLVSGDKNGAWDVFVHDHQTGEAHRVSIASDGTQGNDSSSDASISADGRYVAFDSFASNLVSGDTNGARDVFVHDRCPDGGCTTVPPAVTCEVTGVPVFYQGYPTTPATIPGYKPEWYDDVYGNYPDGDTYNTMGLWGCNTTSNAMAVNFLSGKIGSSFRSDPGQLNSWLRGNSGYTPAPDHSVRYSGVSMYGGENGVYFQIIGSFARDNESQYVEQQLCSGYPVLMKVDSNPNNTRTDDDHFVLAVGKTTFNGQNTYLVNDPKWGRTNLLEHYGDFLATYYYKPRTAGNAGRSMEISAHSPIHLLVTDPLGRKTGYDPRTDQTFWEIPDAGYGLETITSPDGQVLPESKVFMVADPLDGDYTVEVIGYDTGAYTVYVDRSDFSTHVSTTASYTGSTVKDGVDTIVVTVIGENHLYLPILSR
jgi:Tol biopolymer transport system component